MRKSLSEKGILLQLQNL